MRHLLLTLLPAFITALPHNRICSIKRLDSTLVAHHLFHQQTSKTSVTSTSIIASSGTSDLTPNATPSTASNLGILAADMTLNGTTATYPQTTPSVSKLFPSMAANSEGGGQASDTPHTTTVTAEMTTVTITTTKPVAPSSSAPLVLTPSSEAMSETNAALVLTTSSVSPSTSTATPPTTSSLAPAPTPSTSTAVVGGSGGGVHGGAVGLGWNDESGTNIESFLSVPGSKLSWYYNWALTPTSSASGLEFIPQVWGSGSIAGLKAAKPSWPAGTEYVMSFNERELPTVSSITLCSSFPAPYPHNV